MKKTVIALILIIINLLPIIGCDSDTNESQTSTTNTLVDTSESSQSSDIKKPTIRIDSDEMKMYIN